MKTQIENKIKRIYFVPLIERIKLDNEISLELQSTPPFGPEESITKSPEYFNSDPFKNDVG